MVDRIKSRIKQSLSAICFSFMIFLTSLTLIFSKRAVEAIQKTGRICILDVEINGVKSIKMSDLNARYIFVKPPSLNELVSINYFAF